MKLVKIAATGVVLAPVVLLTFCKTNDLSSTTNNENGTTVEITSTGGTFSTPDGLTVFVPMNAVSATVTAHLGTVAAGGYLSIPTSDGDLVSEVFSLEPHGQMFAEPVTITLPYIATAVPTGSTPSILHAGTADPGTAPWDAPVVGANGPLEMLADGASVPSVQVTTRSFSFYAVVLWGGAAATDSGAALDATSPSDGGPQSPEAAPSGTDATMDSGASCSLTPAELSDCLQASDFMFMHIGNSCTARTLNPAACNGCTFTYTCDADDSGTSGSESCTYGFNTMGGNEGVADCATICTSAASISAILSPDAGGGFAGCQF